MYPKLALLLLLAPLFAKGATLWELLEEEDEGSYQEYAIYPCKILSDDQTIQQDVKVFIGFDETSDTRLLSASSNLLLRGLGGRKDSAGAKELLRFEQQGHDERAVISLPRLSGHYSAQAHRQAVLRVIRLLSGHTVRTRNDELWLLVRTAEWFGFDCVIDAIAAALDAPNAIRKYPVSYSDELSLLVDWASQSAAVRELIFLRSFESIFRSEPSKPLATLFSILDLSGKTGIRDTDVADAYFTYCRVWYQGIGRLDDAFFQRSGKSREHWLEFLLAPNSADSLDALKQKWTAIQAALPRLAKHNRIESVRLLLDIGRSISQTLSATDGGDDFSFALLLNERVGGREPALEKVAKDTHLEMISLLVANGADVHVGDDMPLFRAVSNSQLEAIDLLVRSGADVNAGRGRMVHIAVVKRLSSVLDLLLRKYSATVGLDDGEAVRSACAQGFVDMLKMLEEGGGNLGAQDGEALVTAAEHGQREIVDYLLEDEAYADADTGDVLERALLKAGLNGHEEVVKTLLLHGAKPDSGDGYEIIRACRSDKAKMMEMLLAFGCPVSFSILDSAMESEDQLLQSVVLSRVSFLTLLFWRFFDLFIRRFMA
jgi:ankyrin repeat protein